jgi:hypothetical protein
MAGSLGYEGPRPCVLGGTVAMACERSLLLRTPAGAAIATVPLEGQAAGAPAAAGTLFVQATIEGRLLGVDPATGAVKFDLRLTCGGKPLPLGSSPAVVRGRAYLGTRDGRLVAVDLPEASVDGWAMWGGDAARGK